MRRLNRIGIGAGLLLAASAGCSLILGIEDVSQRPGTGGSGGHGTGGGTTSTSSSSGSTGGNATTSSSSSGTGGNPECGLITGKGTRNQVGLINLLNSEPIHYDITANVPQAFVQSSPTQFSKPYPGSGKADGTFEIDSVPCGPYFLDFGTNGFWLTNRSGLDFSTYQTNDLDAAPITNDPQVHLVVNTMTAWADNDVIELIDPNSESYAFDQANGTLSPTWMAGDTTINATGDWINWVYGVKAPVVASSVVSVFHGGVQPGHTYTTIQDFATVSFATPTDMDAGMPTFDIIVNFKPVTHISGGFKLNLDTHQFENVVPLVNPRATATWTTVDYQAHPALLDHGQLMGTADLAFENVTAPAAVINKSYDYGNPFTGWSLVFTVASAQSLTYQLPGANPEDLGALGGFPPLRCDMAPDDPQLTGATPFAPPVKPLQTPPRIDGMSFYSASPVVLASLNPTISWDAPPVPRQYWQIRLVPVQVVNGNTRVRTGLGTVLYVDGSATSVVVPQGYLQPSSVAMPAYYIVAVEGFSNMKNIVYQQTPSAITSPFCVTSNVSDIFQTPVQ